MPFIYLPDGFTITDAEFRASKDAQERVYSIEGGRQADRTYLDALGHARWDTDYLTLRMAGYAHEAALQEMRVRIRAAWQPAALPALETSPPTPAMPAPPGQLPIPTPPSTGLLVGPGNVRTPDPALGARLPLPSYGAQVVASVGRVFPALLRNSCQDDPGGTWEWLDWVVDTLRTHDLRWGYNGKRGNAQDPSKDVVTYHYGAGEAALSTAVYIIDVIGGHCGPTPSAIFNDVTQVTIDGGTIGRWISRGRF